MNGPLGLWQKELEETNNLLAEFRKGKPLSAFDIQVGGDHYKDFAIQPTEFIHKNNLGFLQGCVIKRICRYKFKDKLKDLEKIKHEIDMLIELEYGTDNQP